MGYFVVARNPDAASRLPYLLHLPLAGGGLWLKAKDSWPRTARVYCHELPRPPDPDIEIVQRVAVIICARRGPAIDLILARGLNKRSQFVFTMWRGRNLIFWQTAKTARSVKPGLRVPSGRALPGQPFYADTRERYGYSFSAHGGKVERRALPVGDYAAIQDGKIIGVVERKTIEDFATSLVDGSLTFAMAELAAIPAAAIVVEAPYSALLDYAHTRSGLIPTLVSRLLIRYPQVSINFLESHKVAEEWTYRYLLAAYANGGAMTLPIDGSR
jgi:ERCC4 domain